MAASPSSLNFWYYGILFVIFFSCIATLILNFSSSFLFSSSSSSSPETTTQQQQQIPNVVHERIQLNALRDAFFCPTSNSSTHDEEKVFGCENTHNKKEPIRIAFVGDSIMYGNGTHAGDVAGGKLFQIGSWVNEVIANLKHRADTYCSNSPLFVSSSSSSSSIVIKSSPPFFIPPNARNFGIGKVSVTCKFNQIQKTKIFKQAVMFRPHVLVLGVGLNDCVPYCKEFTKERFVAEMKKIILANFSSAQFVVLVGPPPMEVSAFTIGFGFRPWVVQDTIVPLFRQVSREMNMKSIPFLDVFKEWSIEFKNGTAFENNYNKSALIEKNLLIGDGIHPSLKGHQDIAMRFEKMICGER